AGALLGGGLGATAWLRNRSSGGKMPRPPETNWRQLPQDCHNLPQGALSLSACDLDLARERVLRDDAFVRLTTREAQLLRYLCAREGLVVSREELLVEVWG